MALPAPIQAIYDRLKSKYNGGAYHPTSNPGGFARGGNQQGVFIDAMRDFADYGKAVADIGATVQADADRFEAAVDAIEAGPVTSVNGRTGPVTGLAETASPVFTGTPTAPTQAAGNNSTRLATTAFVKTAVDAAVAAIPVSPAIAPIVVSSPPDNTSASATQTFVAKLLGWGGDTLGFYSDYGFPQASRTLNVYLASSPSVIFKTTTVAGAGNSLSVNLQTLGLSVSTNYLAEIVFTDVLGNMAASAKSRFTTPAQFRPNIGDAYQGGFFTGQINDGGTVFDLIVSPKSGGETTAAWDTTGNLTIGTTSRTAGPTNSAAISATNPNRFPAATFCENLALNGYTDWYLPAIDELEVAYRNLKPHTGNNLVGAGANANSVPQGAAYTATSPAQTSVVAFKSGGSEAFGSAIYYSSTETNASGALVIFFTNDTSAGAQSTQGKPNVNSVRAFRRVAA